MAFVPIKEMPPLPTSANALWKALQDWYDDEAAWSDKFHYDHDDILYKIACLTLEYEYRQRRDDLAFALRAPRKRWFAAGLAFVNAFACNPLEERPWVYLNTRRWWPKLWRWKQWLKRRNLNQ